MTVSAGTQIHTSRELLYRTIFKIHSDASTCGCLSISRSLALSSAIHVVRVSPSLSVSLSLPSLQFILLSIVAVAIIGNPVTPQVYTIHIYASSGFFLHQDWCHTWKKVTKQFTNRLNVLNVYWVPNRLCSLCIHILHMYFICTEYIVCFQWISSPRHHHRC